MVISKLIQEHTLEHSSFGNLNNIVDIDYMVISDPKTASTTVATSIQKAITGNTTKQHVIHMHTDKSCVHRLFPVTEKHNLGILDFIRYRLEKSNKKLHLVTIYREPISRGISHFFHNIQKFTGLSKEELLTKDASFISEMFKDGRIRGLLNFKHVYDTFEEILESKIYDLPFQKNGDVLFYDNGHIRFVMLRMDQLNLNQIQLGEVLNLDSFSLVDKNISSDRWFAPLYQQYKKEAKFDAKILRKSLGNNKKYLELLYSPGDLEALISSLEKKYLETQETES